MLKFATFIPLAMAASLCNAAEAPAHITAAIENTARPEADTVRDANRKPTEMLVLAEVEPGDKVLDIMPGGGYFTRLFGAAVGSEGHVYGLLGLPPGEGASDASIQRAARQTQTMVDLNADPVFAPVTGIAEAIDTFNVPESLDLVWTSLNYHDFHLPRMNVDINTFNARVYEALKPGGLFIVVDHSAAVGSDASVADELHRFPEALAKSEIEAAGFVFVGTSDVLSNPDDPRDIGPFDKSIRGKTDQFVLKFKKPESE